MKITSTGASARGAYYDRNPLKFNTQGGKIAAGPNAVTTRITYTVPTGRKAIVDAAQAWVARVTAATTGGQFGATINYKVGVGGAISAVDAESVSNLGAASQFTNIGQGMLVLAGDSVTGTDVDLSTGGTVTDQVSIQATEFDA